MPNLIMSFFPILVRKTFSGNFTKVFVGRSTFLKNGRAVEDKKKIILRMKTFIHFVKKILNLKRQMECEKETRKRCEIVVTITR